MTETLNALLAGRKRAPAEGRPGWKLRLLSAAEVLEARREASELAADGRERAVCSNACLLARAVERRGKPVFASGKAALAALRLEEIETLSRQWSQFNEAENPSAAGGQERLETLKKAWSTRLMSALSGACSKRSACCRPRTRRGK